MAKKSKVQEKEKSKLTVVQDGKEEIREVNKPTEKEIEQCKIEFETAIENFKDSKWEISEKGSFGANDVAMFIFDFMKNFGFWTKNGWMGMIKMEEELKKSLSFVDDNNGLQLDYHGLEFLAYMLSNPGGIGIQSALEFEKIADKYSKIIIVVGNELEKAREELKTVQYLQEKWAAAQQGFYLSDLEPKESIEDSKECADTCAPSKE